MVIVATCRLTACAGGTDLTITAPDATWAPASDLHVGLDADAHPQAHAITDAHQARGRAAGPGRDVIHLGKLELKLPRNAPPADCGVDVRFTYDVNGLLQVETTLLKTQETSTLLIEGNPGMMSEQEIAESIKALADLKIHPRDRLENRTLMARAERLYEQLRGDTREWLGAQITRFERILASQDKRTIEPNRQRFEELLDQLEEDRFIDGNGLGEPR